MRIGRLFIGAQRTSEMHSVNYSIASWTYQTGYWRWAIFWSPPKSWRAAFCLPRMGPSWASGTRWFISPRWTSIGCWLRLPLIGGLSLHTQPAFEAMKYPAGDVRRARA